MFDFCIDFFNAVPFPVILSAGNGKVLGKNKSAYKYIPEIRIGAVIYSRAKLTKNNNISLIKTASAFKNALRVLVSTKDADTYLLLFTPRLQCEDFDEIEQALSFNDVYKIIKSSQNSDTPNRLYSEMTSAFRTFDKSSYEYMKLCDVVNTVSEIQKRLSSGFKALGFRALVTCSDNIKYQRYFSLNFYSFVYSVMKCAYIAMRISSTGSAEINIDFNEDNGAIEISSVSSSKIHKFPYDKSECDAVSEIVPECAFEIKLDSIFGEAPFQTVYGINSGLFKASASITAKIYDKIELNAQSTQTKRIISDIFSDFTRNIKKYFKK